MQMFIIIIIIIIISYLTILVLVTAALYQLTVTQLVKNDYQLLAVLVLVTVS